MKIGIVGKPNVGKSTLYNALTLGSEKTGNYPFTTIDGAEGVAYVRIKCRCRELGIEDNPNNSICREGWRFIPVKLIDTAGLVPEAWRGRGLGNRFLSRIMEANGLIHVIDASGSTDDEGNPVDPGTYDPYRDIEFVRSELVMWLKTIMERHLEDVEKAIKYHKTPLHEALYTKLSGLAISKKDLERIVSEMGLRDTGMLKKNIEAFIDKLLDYSKPTIYAGNKIDVPTARKILDTLKERGVDIQPISALSEYILKKMDSEGKVRYIPGEHSFKILNEKELSSREKKALNYIKEKIFSVWGGTGVQQLIDRLVFEKLGYIAVYPVRDISKLTDGEGRVLPDVFLLKKGSTLRDLAGVIHSEFGERVKYGYVYGMNTRVSPEYVLKHRDIVSIQIY